MKHGYSKLVLIGCLLLGATLALNGCIMAARKVHQELSSPSSTNTDQSKSSDTSQSAQ